MGFIKNYVLEGCFCPEDFFCPICSRIAFPAYELSCSHIICQHCFHKNKNICPTCNKHDAYPRTNTNSIRMIGEIKCKCKNFKQGCTWTKTVCKFEAHLRECEFEELQCCKCEKTFKRKDLKNHESNECVYRIYQCTYCKKEIIYKDLEVLLHFYKVKCSTGSFE